MLCIFIYHCLFDRKQLLKFGLPGMANIIQHYLFFVLQQFLFGRWRISAVARGGGGFQINNKAKNTLSCLPETKYDFCLKGVFRKEIYLKGQRVKRKTNDKWHLKISRGGEMECFFIYNSGTIKIMEKHTAQEILMTRILLVIW